MKILLIRFSSIGDIILTSPLIKKIKEQYPDALIDYMTLKEYGELLEHNPHINRLYLIERNLTPAQVFKKTKELEEEYSYIFDLHRSTRSLLFRVLIRAGKKFKLNKLYIKRFLLLKLGINLYKEPFSIVNRYFDTAGKLKLIPDISPEIWLDPASSAKCLKKINDMTGLNIKAEKIKDNTPLQQSHIKRNNQQKIISIMPFAAWGSKEWGDTRYIELCKKLNNDLKARVLILGGEKDIERAESIKKGAGGMAMSLAGKTTLSETAVLLAMSDLLVTNDTGLMHLGGAVQTPVIAIFGSTTAELGFFPFKTNGEVIQNAGLKCRPCTAKGLARCPRKHFRCMNDISADRVYSSVKKYAGRISG